MAAQQEISAARLARKIGTTLDVIVDAVAADGIVARSTGDAPEIDGNVFLPADADIRVGDVLTAVVDETDAYDLWATPVQNETLISQC
jgi:ribosomal protein S12 methylthiotransferase